MAPRRTSFKASNPGKPGPYDRPLALTSTDAPETNTVPEAQPSTRRNHIKRPQNAFMLYRSDKNAEMKAENARSGTKGRTQALNSVVSAKMWAVETPEVKELYARRAEEEKILHQLMYPNYKYQPRTKEEIEEDKEREKEERKALKAEKRVEKLKEAAEAKAKAKMNRKKANGVPGGQDFIPPNVTRSSRSSSANFDPSTPSGHPIYTPPKPSATKRTSPSNTSTSQASPATPIRRASSSSSRRSEIGSIEPTVPTAGPHLASSTSNLRSSESALEVPDNIWRQPSYSIDLVTSNGVDREAVMNDNHFESFTQQQQTHNEYLHEDQGSYAIHVPSVPSIPSLSLPMDQFNAGDISQDIVGICSDTGLADASIIDFNDPNAMNFFQQNFSVDGNFFLTPSVVDSPYLNLEAGPTADLLNGITANSNFSGPEWDSLLQMFSGSAPVSSHHPEDEMVVPTADVEGSSAGFSMSYPGPLDYGPETTGSYHIDVLTQPSPLLDDATLGLGPPLNYDAHFYKEEAVYGSDVPYEYVNEVIPPPSTHPHSRVPSTASSSSFVEPLPTWMVDSQAAASTIANVQQAEASRTHQPYRTSSVSFNQPLEAEEQSYASSRNFTGPIDMWGRSASTSSLSSVPENSVHEQQTVYRPPPGAASSSRRHVGNTWQSPRTVANMSRQRVGPSSHVENMTGGAQDSSAIRSTSSTSSLGSMLQAELRFNPAGSPQYYIPNRPHEGEVRTASGGRSASGSSSSAMPPYWSGVMEPGRHRLQSYVGDGTVAYDKAIGDVEYAVQQPAGWPDDETEAAYRSELVEA